MPQNKTAEQARRDRTTRSDSQHETSQSLIVRVKADDPEAWERLVKLYSPLVYYWCQESGLPTADLNDIFQDVFHTLARNINKFRPVKNGSFRGWLRTLTRNKVSDYFRKVGRETQPQGGTEAFQYLQQFPATENRDFLLESDAEKVATASASSDPSQNQEIELERSLLRQALANIESHFSEQTWRAFWLVVVEGRETNDVAADLAMRPGTVRVAKSRVLKRLRLEVGDSLD
jgi:RNA polymerase sigma-70 factor (ECF subfamily)